MSRVNVYKTYYDDLDDYTDSETTEVLAGWFDPTKAEVFEQDKRWDGNNMVGVITGSQWIDEYLYRTKGGRWVLNHDAHRYRGGPDTYQFLTDAQAKDWLLRSECNDDAVERFFGEIEEEHGPGRPGIGEQVCFTIPADDLAEIDAIAGRDGLARSATLRNAVSSYIAIREHHS